MTVPATGARVGRIEDLPLLTGRARFLDDIVLPGQLEAALVRSPYPHARIRSIDVAAALAIPGVSAVLTGQELAEVAGPQPSIYRMIPDQRDTGAHAMALDRVRWVGQPVAAVVATDRYVAEDGVQAVEVEYDPLPVVADLAAALATDAPRLYDGWDDNSVGSTRWSKGDVEQALAAADVTIRQRFRLGRMHGLPLETRGCVASWDPFTDELDLWISTQAPHLARDLLGETLGLPNDRIRVRVPDVGGGFGCKFDFNVEEVIAAVLSRRTGRPVKLIEDRLESFFATGHSREVECEVTLGARSDGTILALSADVLGVLGGALGTVGVGPTWLTAAMLTGPYKVPNVRIALTDVVTNRVPMGSFRGWGQPEANFVYERLIELLARALDLDRNEVRKRNMPAPEEFPFETGVAFTYDSGRYADCLDLCLAEIAGQDWWERQAAARRDGRSVGIGFAFHVEATAFGPSRIMNLIGLSHSGFDESLVRMDATGGITVFTGQAAMGQGIHTTLAQLAADTLGVAYDRVKVISGDTASVPFTGYGTGGSRGAAVGGGAVLKAAGELREKIKRVAAHMLEAAPEDIVVEQGTAHVAGAPDAAVTLAQIGDAAYRRLVGFPEGETPTLEGRFVFDPADLAWSYGCTAAMVDVDRATGVTRVLEYAVAHDCGTVINPTIVDGQIHGGAAQGIAEALFEELVYDDEGQLTNATLADYCIPTASEIPRFSLCHQETPAAHIPGGMKGMGEAGTIGAPAAIANAIDDALADLGTTVTTLPVSPPRLLDLIRGEGAA